MNNNDFLHSISDIFQPILNNKIFFQMTSALSQVVLLILLLSWIIKKFFHYRIYKKKVLLKIRDKISVGPHESIIVIEVQGTKLVLGVTEKNISYLYTLPAFSKEQVVNQKKEQVVNQKKEQVVNQKKEQVVNHVK